MATLAEDLRSYLVGVDADQGALADVQSRKGAALRRADATVLSSLVTEEQALVTRLKRRLGDRADLLNRARLEGRPAASLTEYVEHWGDDDTRNRLARTLATTERLRRETWVHWIVTKHTLGQYDALRELIAHHGKRAPTYEAGEEPTTTGGAVLDASA